MNTVKVKIACKPASHDITGVAGAADINANVDATATTAVTAERKKKQLTLQDLDKVIELINIMETKLNSPEVLRLIGGSFTSVNMRQLE